MSSARKPSHSLAQRPRRLVAVLSPIVFFAGYVAWAFIDRPSFDRMVLTEQGLVEIVTALLFAAASVWAALAVNRMTGLGRLCFAGFSLLCMFVALEEVSYGQHLFGWQAPEFFERHNSQQETNLHNLFHNKPTRRLRTFGQIASVLIFVVLPALLVYRKDVQKLLRGWPAAARRFQAWTANAYRRGHWTFHFIPRLELVVVVLATLCLNAMRSLDVLESLELLELRELYMSATAAGYGYVIRNRVSTKG